MGFFISVMRSFRSRISAVLRGDCRDLKTALPASCALGALLCIIEFLFCLAFASPFSVMGVRVKSIEDLVFAEFKLVILVSQLKILLAYIFIGAASGCAAGYIVHLYARHRNRRISSSRAALFVIPSVFFFTLACLFLDIAHHPALYHEHLYARGGIARSLQVFITDSLPSGTGTILAILAIAPFIPIAVTIAFHIAGILWRAIRAMPGNGRLALAGIALVLVCVRMLAGGRNEGPNIVIIAADSFRYDRVSAHSGRRGLTPHIDSLLAEGAGFDDFHVQLPRTFPSWYCLLSGRYPQQHGIRHMFPGQDDLKKARAELPEILRKHGYTTSAAADYAGDIFTRMSCFDRVRAPRFDFTTMIRQRNLELHFLLLPFMQNKIARALFPELRAFAQNSDPNFLYDDVKSEIRALSGEKRFFLSIFSSTTHFPYASPYPYYKKFTRGEYRGEYKYLKINDITKDSVLGSEDRAQINGLFDGACASVDELVGRIVALLKSLGVYENSIIIFTADHGENLYDHGLDLGHGEHFRGEYATHVPLIIKFHGDYTARMKRRRYGGIMQQIDLAPTLLDVLGIKASSDPAGVSYRRVLEDSDARIRRIAYAETGIWFIETGEQFFQRQRIRYPDVSVLCRLTEPDNLVVLKDEYRELVTIAKHRTVFDEEYKLIYIPTREGARYELYRRGDTRFRNIYSPDHPEARRLMRYFNDLMERYEAVQIVNGIYIPHAREVRNGL